MGADNSVGGTGHGPKLPHPNLFNLAGCAGWVVLTSVTGTCTTSDKKAGVGLFAWQGPGQTGGQVCGASRGETGLLES